MTDRDLLLERAIEAAARAAKAFGNEYGADRAWMACMTLKGMRSAEMVKQLESERLARAAV